MALSIDDIMADIPGYEPSPGITEPEGKEPPVLKSVPLPDPEPEIKLEFPINLEQLRKFKKQWNIETEHKLDPSWCLSCDSHSYQVNPETGSPALRCSQSEKMVAYMPSCPDGKWEKPVQDTAADTDTDTDTYTYCTAVLNHYGQAVRKVPHPKTGYPVCPDCHAHVFGNIITQENKEIKNAK